MNPGGAPILLYLMGTPFGRARAITRDPATNPFLVPAPDRPYSKLYEPGADTQSTHCRRG